MNVQLYTFSKKINSTKRPTGNGTPYTCTAKAPINILNPQIILYITGGATANPSAYNYAYLPDFSRYYYIKDWTNNGQNWIASLAVDSLASWKTQIGQNTIYVHRASYSYDLKIADNMYPQKAQAKRLTVNHPKVWTVGGINAAGANADSYHILAGIIGKTGTVYYAFTPSMWESFYNNLFSDDYYEAVLGEFGATEYPEAKVAVNPMQYISTVLKVPLGLGEGLYTDYTIPIVAQLTRVPVGNVYVPTTPTSNIVAYKVSETPHAAWEFVVEITSDFVHPQADERGDWLNYNPATTYEFFFPPLGTIPLEGSLIADADYLYFTIRCDFRSGTGLLDIEAQYYTQSGGGLVSRRYPLYRGEFIIGCPIQVANVLTPGMNAAEQGYYRDSSSIGAFLTSSINQEFSSSILDLTQKIPIIGSLYSSGIQSAVNNLTPKATSTGKFGSLASMGGQPRLIVTHWYYADDDLAGRGRPLCASRLISSIPGFIKGDSDEISIACYPAEMADIQNAVASGFFYE